MIRHQSPGQLDQFTLSASRPLDVSSLNVYSAFLACVKHRPHFVGGTTGCFQDYSIGNLKEKKKKNDETISLLKSHSGDYPTGGGG